MSMVIRKKQILAATLALALGSAVLVNRYYSGIDKTKTDADETSYTEEYAGENLGDSLFVQGGTQSENGEETTEDASGSDTEDAPSTTQTVISTAGSVAQYFASAKLSRDKAHDEAVSVIRECAENEDADGDIREKAESCLEQFTNSLKLESDTENLIKAKLSCECIVAVNNGKVQVVVSPGVLNTTSTLQISEIIKEQTGINGENISIIEAK